MQRRSGEWRKVAPKRGERRRAIRMRGHVAATASVPRRLSPVAAVLSQSSLCACIVCCCCVSAGRLCLAMVVAQSGCPSGVEFDTKGSRGSTRTAAAPIAAAQSQPPHTRQTPTGEETLTNAANTSTFDERQPLFPSALRFFLLALVASFNRLLSSHLRADDTARRSSAQRRCTRPNTVRKQANCTPIQSTRKPTLTTAAARHTYDDTTATTTASSSH